MKKSIIIISFLLFSGIASATNYYVSSSGNDSNNGLSSSTPWKTIAKVNASSFLPGDNIFFNKGNIWRELLNIPSSGSAGNPITFSAYGTGADPIISGSDLNVSWTKQATNVWKSNVTTQPTIVYFNNTRGTLRADVNCLAPYEWYWASNVLYVYAPGDANPSTTYASPGIEVGNRTRAMQTNNKQFITFSNITFRDGNSLSSPCVEVGATTVNGFIMQYCTIERSTFTGIKLEGSSVATSATVDHCTVNNNGSYGIVFAYLYTSATISNNFIENNGWGSVRDAAPASGIAGFLGNVNIFGNTIYNNGPSPSYDPSQSHGIYVSSSTSATVNIYNNTIYGQVNGSGIKVRYSANIHHNLIYGNARSGIEFGGNDATAVTYNIYYNIIHSSITGSGAGITNGLNGTAHIILENNTFYKDGTNAIELSLQNDVPFLTIKNNIFYAADGRRAIDMVLQTGTDDIDYNLYWQDTQSGNPNFKYNNALPTWAQWKAFGFDVHGVNENPNLVSSSDFHLQAGSPAIGAGINVGLTSDYDGHAINNPPSIGALESVSSTPALPVYVKASVANTAPSLLTMTYSTTLANIVPAASAFTVMVNSAARTVSAVSVSGTMVTLTLSSPVVNGNVVTVAYTKPATNPLQSASGGQAATCSTQTVTNNVSPVTVTPTYVSSSIANASPSVLTMTYSTTLASIVPAASAFAVKVNSAARTVTAVSVSGTMVTLTLSSPVVNGNVVTVAYTKPATNPLQSASGGQAATISAQTVTNNVSQVTVTPAYVSSSIVNASPSVLTMTYSTALASIVPAASAFAVKVNSAARTVTAVSISGSTVLLTLSSPVVNGNTVTVAYTKPATNPLQSTSVGQAATISAQTVTNNVNPVTVTPTYVSSSIANASPSILTMTYSTALASIVPAASAFTVKVNSVTRTVTSLSVSGTTVLLTLSSPVVNGNVVTVAYTKPATNPLQSASGGQAATISAQTVTNNVSPVIITPTYVSSSIDNASPGVLTMTYSTALASIVPATSAFSVKVNSVTRTVTSLSVSGTTVLLTLSSPVVNGNVITVAYTKPAANPLQSTSGGQAATISAQTVTNNVGAVIVTPTYVRSSIDNASPAILTITYSTALASIVPATSAFTVKVNSVTRTLTSLSVSGTTVLLTLSSPVVNGNVVTVAYTKPATNPLQSSSGGQAVTISAQTVTNNVSPVTVTPTYVSSSINNASPSVITINYSTALASIVPAASAFTVKVNSASRTVASVSVSGTNVLLTLSSPVVNGNTVTVAYTKPATNPLQSSSGGKAATISAQTVTNNVNPVNSVIPVYISSAIENSSPSLLTMAYSTTLANIVPAASAFTVKVNSVNRTVNSVSISGTTVLLTLSSPVVNGNMVTVAYTKPASNPLQRSLDGQAATISAQPVTNNVNPVTVTPIFVSSAIENSSPSLLTMTYSTTLASIVPASSAFIVQVNSVNRTVNSVSVSGTSVLLTLSSPVVNGNTVTVAYSKPASNPLQSSSAGQAVTISAQPVTNNVDPVDPVNPVNPVSPVYISSAIENVNPTLLTMEYNIILADIVPDASAFTVMVNSVTRTILSVSISAENVLLTLANPVGYGDVIAVSYTMPVSYPLQSSSGGLATNLATQQVSNNCLELPNPESGINEKSNIVIYPNPAHDFFNISIQGQFPTRQTLKLIDLTGKIVFTELIDQNITNVQIPENINSGLFIISLELGGLVLYTQKLIIYK